MITVERTHNWELIKRIVTHRRVYPHVSGDLSPSAEQWEPCQSDAITYLLLKDETGVLGLFILIPENEVCWKVHTCMLPNAYGDRAQQAARKAIQWVWGNTNCRRIITDVPEYNRLALKYACGAGMSEFGVNVKSFVKQGQLHDQICLGISKPEGK